ncbi:2'-5' RNA ligase family protein [uncultured Flavobacterium sp.]|uniref:2'-5' RNA ligase family protein n=1 Tax=uncultured Flavobacterium sp. TaxID=165435 RepID=UPI0025DA84DE|nr:2'-5' RNA ligase family protein [uncultured Flavobacterium sp.]
MARETLYFIALLPHTTVSDEITAFRHDFAQNYMSSRALRTMPHITLKAPFKLPDTEHDTLLDWFNSIRPDVGPFIVELEDFGSFDNKNNPVIYVKPLMTPQLQALQASIVNAFEKNYPQIGIHYVEQKFHPHMTIAYRDLTAEQYERAMNVYRHKKYSATFRADRFFLFHHNGEQWNIVAEHLLV